MLKIYDENGKKVIKLYGFEYDYTAVMAETKEEAIGYAEEALDTEDTDIVDRSYDSADGRVVACVRNIDDILDSIPIIEYTFELDL